MANRNLTENELVEANSLLVDVRKKLEQLSGGDRELLFAYRRKIGKELGYDERSKPNVRNKLKALKWGLQNRLCAHCLEEMPLKYSELDRKNAVDGYTESNTELVHAHCHHERQAAKKYT